MAWRIRSLSRQAEARPSTASHQWWRVDLKLIRSTHSTLVRETDHTLDLYSPFDNAVSIPVLPSHWYLASSASHAPLIFDITHHVPELPEHEGTHETTRFRLHVSHPPSQENLKSNTAAGRPRALSVERVSRFRFPPCRVTFEDQVQIPGWFSVALTPTARQFISRAPGRLPCLLTCIYEPGLGTEVSKNESSTVGTDEELENNRGMDGDIDPVKLEIGSGTRGVRLSMLYQGSILGVGACISGRVAHGLTDHASRLSSVCVLNQELFPRRDLSSH